MTDEQVERLVEALDRGDRRVAEERDGEWVVESFEGPKDGPPGQVTFRFADGRVSILEGKKEKPEEAAYTVDPTRKPAHIDIRPEKGKKDLVVYGIYELSGDTLKLAFGFDGRERPTEFKGNA